MAMVLNMATGKTCDIPAKDAREALIRAVTLGRKAFDDDSPAPTPETVAANINRTRLCYVYGDYTVLVNEHAVTLTRFDGESDEALHRREQAVLERRATRRLNRMLTGQ